MTASPPALPSRPRIVNIAFWCWLAAATITAALGLLQATQPAPLFFRLIGGVLVVIGVAVALLAGKTRAGDPRFRRAAIALSLVTVVIVGLIAVFGVMHVLTLLSVLPLIAGAVCITRPPAQEWFSESSESSGGTAP